MDSAKLLLFMGSLVGAAGVVAGAVGAHLVKPGLTADAVSSYDTAVNYLFVHVLAMLMVAILLKTAEESLVMKLAGWSFFMGTLLFSGSLLVRAIFGLSWSLPTAPVGGILLILAWLLLGVGALIG